MATLTSAPSRARSATYRCTTSRVPSLARDFFVFELDGGSVRVGCQHRRARRGPRLHARSRTSSTIGRGVSVDRLERPDQPDVLRDARPPEAVRLLEGQGDPADAAGPQRREGGRLQRHARRRPSSDVARLHAHGLWATMRQELGVRARPGGGVELRLSSDERSLLARLVAELRSLLDGAPGDPSLRRLFPAPAYRRRPHDELAYRDLMAQRAARRPTGCARPGRADRSTTTGSVLRRPTPGCGR